MDAKKAVDEADQKRRLQDGEATTEATTTEATTTETTTAEPTETTTTEPAPTETTTTEPEPTEATTAEPTEDKVDDAIIWADTTWPDILESFALPLNQLLDAISIIWADGIFMAPTPEDIVTLAKTRCGCHEDTVSPDDADCIEKLV